MVEWREIGLVLIALYLLECVFWLRAGLVAFVSGFGAARATVSSETGVRSFPDFGPWVPFGLRFKVQQWPVMVSPTGIQQGSPFLLVRSLQVRPFGRSVRFEEITSIAADNRDLLVNGESFAHFADHASARRFAARLQAIRKLPERERAHEINAWLAERLDPQHVATKWSEFRRRTRGIRVISTLQFVVLVLTVPTLLWMLVAVSQIWLLLLEVWVGLLVLHSILFVRAHRALYPGATGSLIQSLVLHTLVPVTVTRASIHLSEKVLIDHEPLAVAKLLAGATEFRTLARHVLGGVTQPSRLGQSEISHWFAEHFTATAERLLLELPHDQVFAMPEQRDADGLTYCPRCHEQYVVSEGCCQTCNLKLKPLFGAAPE
jgi:hypothetical protein